MISGRYTYGWHGSGVLPGLGEGAADPPLVKRRSSITAFTHRRPACLIPGGITLNAKRNFECRFAIGEPNGDHSDAWKIWASRDTSDLYIVTRSIAKSVKISIHASGQRHFGFTKEQWNEMQIRGDLQILSRHWSQWQGGIEIGPDHTLEYRLRFPTSEL